MPVARILPTAHEDLFEIWDYIAQDNVDAADTFAGRIHETYELLAEQPEMGRKREELAPRLRSFPVESYVIYYRPLSGGEGIVVVRVLHGAQDVQESRFE